MKVHNGKVVFIYNKTHKKWVTNAILRHVPEFLTSNILLPVPLLESSSKFAAKFIVKKINKHKKQSNKKFSLFLGDNITFEMIQDTKDHRNMIGTFRKRVTSLHGNRVFLFGSEHKQNIQWSLVPCEYSRDRHIRIGVSYNIKNMFSESYLNKRDYDIWQDENVLVTQSPNFTPEKDEWVLIPSDDVYICTQESESGCVKSVNRDNTFLDVSCTNGQCKDKFGNSVYDTQPECLNQCHIHQQSKTEVRLSVVSKKFEEGEHKYVYINTFVSYLLLTLFLFILIQFQKMMQLFIKIPYQK